MLQCRDSRLPLRLTLWKAESLMGNQDPQPVGDGSNTEGNGGPHPVPATGAGLCQAMMQSKGVGCPGDLGPCRSRAVICPLPPSRGMVLPEP